MASAALLEGLRSHQSEDSGWNSILRTGVDPLSFVDIDRIDDFSISINVRQFADYFVTAPETLSIEIPAVSLLSSAALTLPLTLPVTVNATNGRPTFAGSLLRNLTDGAVQDQLLELLILLEDDTWIADLTEDANAVAAVAASIRTGNAGVHGWDVALQVPGILCAPNLSPNLSLSDAMPYSGDSWVTKILAHSCTSTTRQCVPFRRSLMRRWKALLLLFQHRIHDRLDAGQRWVVGVQSGA